MGTLLKLLGMIPARWLVDTMDKVDFVLTVFSAGSSEIMKGRKLKRELPYPDLFGTAMNHIYAVSFTRLLQFLLIKSFYAQGG